MRKIIHVDMDAFYASVEQRDNPELRGKPIAVGGSSRRGVVTTASYEARKFGVRSAMSSVVAERKCPGLIFVKTRFQVYREVSRQIREIFHRYTSLVEPLSLDEAFLDVSEPLLGPPSATLIANEIRSAIQSETGLTASAGVSFNKFLAKVGSDVNKPNGITVITPADAPRFIEELPIEKFFGVGPVTSRKMHTLGIGSGADLLLRTEEELRQHFGKAGGFYYRIVRCEDDRPVRNDRERKSVGTERTFELDISDIDELRRRLREIAGTLSDRMEKASLMGQTITLKIKYGDFSISTRQSTSSRMIYAADDLFACADLLLTRAFDFEGKSVRLVGVSVSKLRSIKDGPVSEQMIMSFSEDAMVI
jgi:DNA polymerase IV